HRRRGVTRLLDIDLGLAQPLSHRRDAISLLDADDNFFVRPRGLRDDRLLMPLDDFDIAFLEAGFERGRGGRACRTPFDDHALIPQMDLRLDGAFDDMCPDAMAALDLSFSDLQLFLG